MSEAVARVVVGTWHVVVSEAVDGEGREEERRVVGQGWGGETSYQSMATVGA